MKNRIAKSTVAVTVALGLVFAAPMAAMADASATYYSGGSKRATSYWNASQDRMSTTDLKNDGWGSRVKWNRLGNKSAQSNDNLKGAGQTVSIHLWVLPSWRFRINACSIKNGTEKGCTPWSAYSGV